MAGAFPLPYGLGGRYTAQTNRIEATFDSRRPGTYPPDRAPCPRVSPLDARVQPVVGAAYVAARSRAHAAFHAAGMSGGRSRAMTIPRESRGKM